MSCIPGEVGRWQQAVGGARSSGGPPTTYRILSMAFLTLPCFFNNALAVS